MNSNMTTCHSEFGAIETIYLKTAKDSFVDQKTLSTGWKALNYLDEPNFDQALSEYREFEYLLTQGRIRPSYFDFDDNVGMDSIYCRDASIATDFGIIICNMGKEGRKKEPSACLRVFDLNQEPILGKIQSPGTLEGGDVAWLDKNTLAVGRTYRSNDEGIRQLKALLEPRGVSVLVVNLPHYKGPSDVFHLMSILSPVDANLAVVYSPLMPISFREELLRRKFELVEVPEEEFESMGCNVLAVSPRNCIMVAGNPITKQRLEEAGASVQMYAGSEISVKGGGGPTCLTRPLKRKI
jgi:N-dimethylarginine dimethylaminohydrolase